MKHTLQLKLSGGLCINTQRLCMQSTHINFELAPISIVYVHVDTRLNTHKSATQHNYLPSCSYNLHVFFSRRSDSGGLQCHCAATSVHILGMQAWLASEASFNIP